VVVTFHRWLQNSVKLPLKYGRSKLGANRISSSAVVISAKQSVAPPKNMHVISMYSQYTARRGSHWMCSAAQASVPHAVRLSKLAAWWRRLLRLLPVLVCLLALLATKAAHYSSRSSSSGSTM
jgi:hypothetical protein